MQGTTSGDEGPQWPRSLTAALMTGYATGYAAALNIGAGVTGDQAISGQTAALTASQGVIAAVCWVFWRRHKQ